MPFARPPLSTLRAQAQADMGTASLLRFSNLRVIADILAKGFNALYGYLDYIALQSNPFTATDEFLEAWAALKRVIRKAGTPAILSASFPGTANANLPAGTPVSRADGFAYVTTADATVGTGGTVTVDIQATAAGLGSAGNADAGAALSLAVGVTGVSAAGSVLGQVAAGADVELDAQLRTRMLIAYSSPPQGGSVTDYQGWAESVAGVTRAWVGRQVMGPGTVVVYFMMDDAEAAHGGFPQGTDGVASAETRDAAATGDQLAVANYVYSQATVTALVYAVAPKPNTIDLTISGLATASATVQTAIAAAIAAVFLANGSPGGTVQMSDVNAAINSVAGSSGFLVTSVASSSGSGSPTTNLTSNAGYLPELGPITWA